MEDELEQFLKLMRTEMNEHEKVYEDTWKKQDIIFLEQRMNAKHNEFRLTKNPDKLISLANLAMLLYVRRKNG
jgi:hypothetical protein